MKVLKVETLNILKTKKERKTFYKFYLGFYQFSYQHETIKNTNKNRQARAAKILNLNFFILHSSKYKIKFYNTRHD